MGQRRENDLDRYETGSVPKRGRKDKAVRIMDPVHNFIDVSEYPVVLELIDTPHFQRLKSLQQLGLASVAYPSATHTRFAHSVGVMYVFLTLFDSVSRASRLSRRTAERIRPVGAVAALLHDIGHGPLSHASERFLEGGKFSHERMTRDIIASRHIAGVLRRNGIDPRLVADLLRREAPAEMLFVSQLLSSQLDADRMDYLMRDSLFTGLQYGRIDMHRIASTLRLWDGGGPAKMRGTVVVDEKGAEAVASYVLARHFMYRGVYQHKAIRSAESMLAVAFRRASAVPGALGPIPGAAERVTPASLLSMDDHTCYGLLRRWAESKDSVLRDLSLRLLRRDLFKSIAVAKSGAVPGYIRSAEDVGTAFRKSRLDISYYFIDDDHTAAGYRPYRAVDSSEKDAEINHIMVADKAGNLEEISEWSKIVEATTRLPGEARVFCPGAVAGEVGRILGGGARAR